VIQGFMDAKTGVKAACSEFHPGIFLASPSRSHPPYGENMVRCENITQW
jgi:hypothetical protein